MVSVLNVGIATQKVKFMIEMPDFTSDLPQKGACSHEIHLFKSDEPHAVHPGCFCEPYLNYKDPVDGREVWVHRRMDN